MSRPEDMEREADEYSLFCLFSGLRRNIYRALFPPLEGGNEECVCHAVFLPLFDLPTLYSMYVDKKYYYATWVCREEELCRI